MTPPRQPEPCIAPRMEGSHQRCFSPLACEAWGYCRERNADGVPSAGRQAQLRTEAAGRREALDRMRRQGDADA